MDTLGLTKVKSLFCHSLKKVDSQNQKTNANQTFTQTGALS